MRLRAWEGLPLGLGDVGSREVDGGFGEASYAGLEDLKVILWVCFMKRE